MIQLGQLTSTSRNSQLRCYTDAVEHLTQIRYSCIAPNVQPAQHTSDNGCVQGWPVPKSGCVGREDWRAEWQWRGGEKYEGRNGSMIAGGEVWVRGGSEYGLRCEFVEG
jgi:hypothetical protein